MNKPWQDAKAGEAWVLTFADYADVLGGAYIAGDWTFITADHGVPLDDERITGGYRIWPVQNEGTGYWDSRWND